jgi:hypothetical protein
MSQAQMSEYMITGKTAKSVLFSETGAGLFDVIGKKGIVKNLKITSEL